MNWTDPPDEVKIVTHRYRNELELLVEETICYHVYNSADGSIACCKIPGFLERRIVQEKNAAVDVSERQTPALVATG